jgi:hypothetical protein
VKLRETIRSTRSGKLNVRDLILFYRLTLGKSNDNRITFLLQTITILEIAWKINKNINLQFVLEIEQ